MRLDRLLSNLGELWSGEFLKPEFIVAAACNDDSDGECGDGGVCTPIASEGGPGGAIITLGRACMGDTLIRDCDGGRELRSGAISIITKYSPNKIYRSHSVMARL